MKLIKTDDGYATQVTTPVVVVKVTDVSKYYGAGDTVVTVQTRGGYFVFRASNGQPWHPNLAKSLADATDMHAHLSQAPSDWPKNLKETQS